MEILPNPHFPLSTSRHCSTSHRRSMESGSTDLRSEESVSLVTSKSMRLGRWEAAIGSLKMSSLAPELSSPPLAATTMISPPLTLSDRSLSPQIRANHGQAHRSISLTMIFLSLT
ncbi:hypothetical protein FCV25MIE_32637 [Fagus crenata]